MKIILGSQSEGRRKILKEMGFVFEVIQPNLDEKTIRFEDPYALTMALARAKADALLPRVSNKVILITSDQVSVWRGKIREKPADDKEAREFLTSYSTDPAQTITAVVVTNTATGKRCEGIDIAKVWLKPLPEEIILEYINCGDVFHQSGGFSIDHPILKNYVERIEGAEDSIIGLPKELTLRLIREAAY